MATNHKPEGYHTVTPYLFVADVAKLIEFLQSAFDAEELYRMQRPNGDVGHAKVRIGESMIEIGKPSAKFPAMQSAIHLYLPDTDAAFRKALDAGAKPFAEPSDRYYGDREAGVYDPFGNVWFLSTRVKDMTAEEMRARAATDAKDVPSR
jgi:PhnB protein